MIVRQLYCNVICELKNEFSNKIGNTSSVMIAFYHGIYAVSIYIISRKVTVHYLQSSDILGYHPS